MKRTIFLFSLSFISMGTFAAGDKAKGKAFYKKVNCAMCHGPKGLGKAKNGKLAVTKGPPIAGLDEKYIVKEMTAIQIKKRKSKYTTMMVTKIKKLSPQDMRDVAAYAASLGPRIKGMKQKK